MGHDFVYEAVTEAGETVRGTLRAASLDEARERLLAMDCLPLSVRAGRDRLNLAGWTWSGFGGVGARDRILFTRQLRTMLGAGVPMLTILTVLRDQAEHPRLAAICDRMAADVKRGAALSEALAAHGAVFSELYVSMVRAGEASGSLPRVLDRLVFILSHEHAVRNDVRSALQYPLTVAVALVAAFFFLVTFVVPTFARMFAKAHLDLPWPTRIAVGLNEAVLSGGLALPLAALAVLVGLSLWFRTVPGRSFRDRALLSLPLVGGLLRKAAMSRFAALFSILQESGLPVLSALGILGGAIGNAAVAGELDHVADGVRAGRGLAGPLAQARYFTPMVVSMVAVGEESGTLDAMLAAVSEHYDAEVAHAVKRLSEALGPVLVLGLAVVVGFFALAVFMPMWDMTRLAGRF